MQPLIVFDCLVYETVVNLAYVVVKDIHSSVNESLYKAEKQPRFQERDFKKELTCVPLQTANVLSFRSINTTTKKIK